MRYSRTHTYAELEVSASTYDEIAEKLRAAGWGHAFIERTDEDGQTRATVVVDGVGLVREEDDDADTV